MRRFTSRVVAPLTAVSLLLAAAGCGSEDSTAATGGLETVTIEGEFGAAPEVTWDGELLPSELETEVLVPGDGPEVADGDQVLADLWIGNGYTQSEAYSTFAEGGTAEMLRAGGDISPGIQAALEGHPIGSRVAVAAPPKDAFGETGNAGLGLGNGDGVLFVVDIVSEVLDGPRGQEQDPPKRAPVILEEDGKPVGFDFSRARKPGKDLEVITLVAGDGPEVEAGQGIAAHYLGSVFGKKKVFDQSYANGEPTPFPVGVGGVIEGWDQGLVGATVGSRLILVVPSRLGYGKAGQGEDIKGGDDLVFVVDILAAG